MLKTILQYQTSEGKAPFREWLLTLDRVSRARIRARLDRLRLGNFGDAKPVGQGVFELRFHFNSGYRIYYALDGREVVLLLLGGDKSSQTRDISKAKQYWNDYLRRRS